jgi:hypothetical protein
MKFTVFLLRCLVLLTANLAFGVDAPLDIASRRELFVDDFLIHTLTGKAEQRLHHPQPQEIVIKHDQPWEGSGSGFHSIFKDGNKYAYIIRRGSSRSPRPAH